MRTGRMIYRVPTTACGAAFQCDELLHEPWKVEEIATARIDVRQEILVKLTLGFGCRFVVNATLPELFDWPFPCVSITLHHVFL
jgi:hypothetical protein